jgi:hypothetical protein
MIMIQRGTLSLEDAFGLLDPHLQNSFRIKTNGIFYFFIYLTLIF